MKVQNSILRTIWLVLCLPLFLLFLPQALYVKKHTIRLPQAKGLPFGEVANDRHDKKDHKGIRLLHVGESTVAGVGVEHLTSGFTHCIAQSLSDEVQAPINFSLFGENGIRINALNERLPLELEQLIQQQSRSNATQFDLSVVTMGVNDATKFTSVKDWRKSVVQTVHILKSVTKGPIFFTQVPPLAQFPALPAPLKYLLGVRSSILDNELKQICETSEGVHYVGSKLQVAPEMMAIDGYHPSELGYQHWGKQISLQINDTLNG